MLHDDSRQQRSDGKGTPTLEAIAPVIDKARELAAAGHHAAVVEFLGGRERTELGDSPTLALLYGIAQARLGRHEQALQWLELALEQARRRGESAVERHALSARGAFALVNGHLTEAADFCTQALMAASRDGDHATTGRASNNLGIISHLRGRHAEAISSWEIAAAAFHRAGQQIGVAECHNNLANAYREQGALDKALAVADQAVATAEAGGDEALFAVTLRGRAEIRVVRSEPELARRELDRVREIRSRLPDPVGEAEDLRVTALVLAAEGQVARAEKSLREVMGRAELHGRIQLQADATRDLALLLRKAGRQKEAIGAAQAAKAIFSRIGAESDIRKLAEQGWEESVAAELRGNLAPLHVAQQYADAGRYAELLTYLEQRSRDELEESAMLTLLYGIAHSRLGRLEVGQQWAMVAQLRARALKDRMVEVRVARGESELAKQEVERAIAVHRELKDPVREAEDLRILASALALTEKTNDAETMLRDVIDRATQHGRPLLLASAERDLAHLLIRSGDVTAGKAAAQRARATFQRLSARAEIDRLDALLEAP